MERPDLYRQIRRRRRHTIHNKRKIRQKRPSHQRKHQKRRRKEKNLLDIPIRQKRLSQKSRRKRIQRNLQKHIQRQPADTISHSKRPHKKHRSLHIPKNKHTTGKPQKSKRAAKQHPHQLGQRVVLNSGHGDGSVDRPGESGNGESGDVSPDSFWVDLSISS